MVGNGGNMSPDAPDPLKRNLLDHYLGQAGGAEPVPLWDAADAGAEAVGVEAAVAAVTQQQQLLVVSSTAQLAALQRNTATQHS